MNILMNLIHKIVSLAGYDVKKKNYDTPTADIRADVQFMTLYEKCKPYTTTSIERLYSLFNAVNYILDNNLSGDFVECGVWKGGSSLMMAMVLKERGQVDRLIYLFDTFEGMSEPTTEDKTAFGEKASDLLARYDRSHKGSIWFDSSLDEVKRNMSLSDYPTELLVFVKGKVEETLDSISPQQIALLRLDTDWYESTKKELEVLFPKLADGGILIIDDFGHWEGAKKAVLEYFTNSKPLLHRIDNTGRILIKKNQ